jgi:DNA primase
VAVEKIEDIRVTKRHKIVDRAKELLVDRFEEGAIDSTVLLDEVRDAMRIEKVSELGPDRVPAGPNVTDSDAIIIVEGRADVINLLRFGIKNAVAVEGTKVPPTIVDLCQTKTATAFLDGDRGGELILRELLQVADIDFVAYAPRGRSVEDMSRKEITKALRNKVPVEFLREQMERPATEGKPSRAAGAEGGTSREREEARPESGRGAGARKYREAEPAGTFTLRSHVEEVQGRSSGRFLSPDFSVLLELKAQDLERVLESLKGDVTGLVIDRVMDQRLLDLLAAKGLEFVVARDYRGIIKRPLSIKILKMSQF